MRWGGSIEKRYGVDEPGYVPGENVVVHVGEQAVPPAPRPSEFATRDEYRWALRGWRRQHRAISGWEVVLILVVPGAALLLAVGRLFRGEVAKAAGVLAIGVIVAAAWLVVATALHL